MLIAPNIEMRDKIKESNIISDKNRILLKEPMTLMIFKACMCVQLRCVPNTKFCIKDLLLYIGASPRKRYWNRKIPVIYSLSCPVDCESDTPE